MEAFLNLILGGTGLTLSEFATLCATSMTASFITVSMGIGGGTLVLAVMALILPPTVLIPVHAVVQLGSNAGRAALMFGDLIRDAVLPFLIGTLIGASIGAQVVVALPTAILQAILAGFILYATWAPKFRAHKPSNKTFFGVGLLATFATMFVGATGPLVAPFVSAYTDKRQNTVATLAMLMTIQHGFKMIAFGLLGFAFGPYIPLLVGLIGFGFIGTFVGRKVLNKLPERVFKIGLKVILTALAGKLLYGAAFG